jgi:DNA-binding NarL/FixJ family response regulator
MRPQHFGDELRAALRSGPSTWGLLLLHRYEGERPFSPSDVQFLDELSRPLAEVMRSQVLQEMAMTAPASAGPGLMMFGADGHLESLNEAAQGWLAQLPYRTVDDIDTPVAVYTALAHARAVARGHQRGTARVRALSESGQWLVVHASSLVAVDGSAGPTAVVIEPASRVDLMPIIVDAYQLSAREQQVIGALARGSSTAEMAAELFLSPHTVRDHIKSIFAKVGVSSRSELVAQLFAEHYEPVVERRVAHA